MAGASNGRPRPGKLALPLLLGILLVGTLGSAPTSAAAEAPSPRQQRRFMWAMAGQESGWDYYNRNTASGAFGKYQIMPANWPSWAEKYLGDRDADQTPWNQETVAFGKLRDLYRWLGSWKRVAYWWLTGSSERRERRWSSYASGYVDNIMQLRKRAPRNGVEMPAQTSSRATRGDWRRVAAPQRLRHTVAGRAWRRDARLREGQVVKVRASARTPWGVRWIRVLTADGRLGWFRQASTLPASRPAASTRWHDVRKHGGHDTGHDRRAVRPRPR